LDGCILKSLTTFENLIDYKFREPQLLVEALTHKSYAHEKATLKKIFAHNERLEFLGDAVLELTVSSLMMQMDFIASEGDLSKRRASLVNETALAEIAREILLYQFVILGRGEVCSGGTEKNSILASTFEAVLGAVFLDGGFEAAYKIVEKLYKRRLDELPFNKPYAKDYKTRLQEVVQGKYKVAPQYRIEATEGPDHKKVFQVAILIGEKKLSQGVGSSRKEAEQDAAKRVLEEMNL
jgi:ribonuclease-3